MKPRLLLLTLSLVANAALLGAWLTAPAASSPAQTTDDTKAATVARPAPASGAPAADAAVSPDAAKAEAANAFKPGFSWSAAETDDLDELVRRLKAAGFTPREIRAILRDVINRRGRPPGADEAARRPYWRATWGTVSQDAKARDEQRKRDLENSRLSRKYTMGPDTLADDPDQLDYARQRWGDLPLEKLQTLAALEADYDEIRTKQLAADRARPGEEGNALATYQLMQKEYMADIAKLLTPEEFAAFELRSGLTASLVRYRLEGFNATEAEYKAIHAINQPYSDRLLDPRLGADGHKALQAEISAKVKEVLGADRALDYEAVMNHNAQDQTGLLVNRLGLPARIAVEVRQTAQDFTQRGKDIRANASLSPADRDTQLAALAQQATTQLKTKLGADGFEAYSDLKGDWLRALQPKSVARP